MIDQKDFIVCYW